MAQAENQSSTGSDAESSSPSGGRESAEGVKLEEVVVTAQKRSERLQDVPVPVTALNTQALVEQNQLRLQDYYSSVPGLNLTIATNGAPNLSIRGLTTGGLSTNPIIGVVVDDVPYGSSSAAGGGRLIPDFDPSDLARIEVLRGPQGTLYGASSLGGLIKFVTVDPSTEGFSGRVQAGTSGVSNGSELGYNARGAVNVPVSDTFALRASGFARRDPGYIDDVQTGEKGVNRTDVDGGLLAALWRPSEVFSLKLSALYQDFKEHGSSGVNPQIAPGDLQQSVLRGIGGYDRQMSVYTATLKAKLSGVDLTAISSYAVNKFSSSFDWGSSPLGLALSGLAQNGFPGIGFNGYGVSGAAQLDDIKTNKFSQELRLSGLIGQHLDWLLGGFYTHESSSAFEDESAINSVTVAAAGSLVNFDFPTTVAEYAGFGDLTFHFTDRFNVQLGGRQSWNRQTYSEVDAGPLASLFYGLPAPVVTPEVHTKDDSFTYLVTPQFKISPDLMVYARLASAYRVGGPNTNCTLFDSPCHFKPDTTTTYELGVKGSVLGPLLSLDASLFYINWKDIQLQGATPEGVGYVVNGGRAKSDGVELSVESRPLKGLALTAWATWNDAVLTEDVPASATISGVDGDRLPFSSRFAAHFSLQQDFPLSSSMNGFVGASVSYVGDRLSDFLHTGQRTDLPGYAQADARAGLIRDSWTLNVFATNITDKRGLLSSAGLTGIGIPTAYQYIRPRTVGVALSKTW